MKDEDAARRMIRELWLRNRPITLERLAVVRAAVDRLSVGSLDPVARNEARTEAHKLRGILGTYGFAEASEIAAEAEELLAGDDDRPPVADLASRLAACTERLEASS